jgi:hypothetical protein
LHVEPVYEIVLADGFVDARKARQEALEFALASQDDFPAARRHQRGVTHKINRVANALFGA